MPNFVDKTLLCILSVCLTARILTFLHLKSQNFFWPAGAGVVSRPQPGSFLSHAQLKSLAVFLRNPSEDAKPWFSAPRCSPAWWPPHAALLWDLTFIPTLFSAPVRWAVAFTHTDYYSHEHGDFAKVHKMTDILSTRVRDRRAPPDRRRRPPPAACARPVGRRRRTRRATAAAAAAAAAAAPRRRRPGWAQVRRWRRGRARAHGEPAARR